MILTSDKMPTFASPRVWGLTTASPLGRGSYTTRSPQGYNPFNKVAPTTTTTTSAPFFRPLGLASKGESSGLKNKVPLPVGMLGTPAPSYENIKNLLLSRGRLLPAGGTVRAKLLPKPTLTTSLPVLQTVKPTVNRQVGKLGTPASSYDNVWRATVRAKLLPQPAVTTSQPVIRPMKPTIQIFNRFNIEKPKKDSIETLLKKMLQKNNPSFAAVPAVPVKKKQIVPTRFPVLEAVPTKPLPFPTKRLPVPTSPSPQPPAKTVPPQTFFSPMPLQPVFSAVPAVPKTPPDSSSQRSRRPKHLSEITVTNRLKQLLTTMRPRLVTSVKSVTKFPTFRNFPTVNERSPSQFLTPRPTIQMLTPRTSPAGRGWELFSPVTREPPTLSPSFSFGSPSVAVPRPPTPIRKTSSPSALEQLKASLQAVVTSSPRQRTRPTTQRPASLPRGTTRGEIMALLKASTTAPTTTSTSPQPHIQVTTNRNEVIRLLHQLLGSVKPSEPSTTTPTTTTTIKTTTTTTTPTTTVATFSSFRRGPSLRFDAAPQLQVDVAARELPFGMTTATPVHPHSPFPHIEAPQHDLLSSHLLLPQKSVTPASTVHPTSPFPNLQAPHFRHISDNFQTDFISESEVPGVLDLTEKLLLPRHDLLPPDPARPGPTPPPGPLKLRLEPASRYLESQLPRSGRHHREHTKPKWHTPRPSLEAPPPLYPKPRTRLVAPRSQQPAMNRRLSIDGPTEASMTPLEALALGTVPRLQPDTSYFGTPRSRQLEAQSPLERLAGELAGVVGGWHDGGPMPRTRHQRMNNQPGSSEVPQGYHRLPGVQTGTTALGLVEHRGNQPIFHVPIFTTPIPKNGKFVTRNPDPLRGFAASLRNITSSRARPPVPLSGPAPDLSRVQGATKVRDIPVTPPPHLGAFLEGGRGGRPNGRRLDTFSRYTTFRNSSGRGVRGVPFLQLLLTVLVIYLMR